MKKTIAIILSLCMALSLLTACGSDNTEDESTTDPASQDPATSSTIGNTELEEVIIDGPGLQIRDEYLAEKVIIGVSGDGTTLAPWGRAVFGQAEARNIVVQKLLRADSDGVIHYELAKEVNMIDELTYEIVLWEGIHDSLGNPFTTSDVVFSMEEYLGTGNSGMVNKFDHYEIVDELTVIWHCSRPFAIGEFARQLANCNMTTEAAYEASSDEMTTTLVGTGPYKVKSFTPGSILVLEVDENFWMRDLPEDVREELWVYNYQNVREIEYHVIKDASQRAIALQMGTVDAIDDIADVDLIAFAQNPDITPVYALNRAPIAAIYNCNEASPCSDINLRMAISYAIDTQALVAGIGDHTFQIYGFQPNLIDSPEDWKTGREYYDYDLDTAKEYLSMSSYNGEQLVLMYPTSNTGVSYEEVAIVLQSQLRAAGITVVLKGVDLAVNEVDRFDPTAWDIRMDAIGGGDYMVNVMKNFSSGAFETDLNGKNILLIVDDTLDQLFADLEADSENPNKITALDDYFTYENCYGIGLLGAYLRTASRSSVNAVLGDRGALMVPNAFTYNN